MIFFRIHHWHDHQDDHEIERRLNEGGVQLLTFVEMLDPGVLDEHERRVIAGLGAAVVSVWHRRQTTFGSRCVRREFVIPCRQFLHLKRCCGGSGGGAIRLRARRMCPPPQRLRARKYCAQVLTD